MDRKQCFRMHCNGVRCMLALAFPPGLTVWALTLCVTYPLNSEIDNVTNYLSTVPLRELGLGLGEVHLTDEQAQELTDDYSLPALKVLFQLWVVAEVTGPLRHALAGCLGDLQRSYDFHRYFETQHQSQGSDRNGRARQKCRELNVLHTSVRSLQLHLKALLNEVIILEDELEKLMVSRETVETACAEELQDRLLLLQPHMQASCGCWEETVMQLDRMLRRAANSPGTPDRDPVPEEQELEAYASDSDSDSEWRGPLLDLLSPEELERQRQEREESYRVLLELKAVLGLRASEVERQKWKQLLFSDQAALKAAVALELSEPHRTHDPAEPQGHQNNHTATSQPEEGPALFSPTETRFSCGRRLTDGSAALGFSPALAAQAAARSLSFTNAEEQTFGEEEEEEEGEREGPVGEEEVTS
ncbi:hypothetical protein AAFF_G00061140 [Aldrovandia affinis]|uniref:Vezatin n=1 Tax=Aldrovandia affinis TaxID=143900 RepID=A0AAD7RZT1_9TELE|nr:hypothetical protein AAFF_G00061140 [Aldrovandia affinis]